MTPERRKEIECTCTEDTDCDGCVSLETAGAQYIDANGDKGVAMLVRERDACLEEIDRLNAEIRDMLSTHAYEPYHEALRENRKLRELLTDIFNWHNLYSSDWDNANFSEKIDDLLDEAEK